ncbi:MAG TPA: biopolymer transporter ExbD [Tepidisphaeraceae bacterium]|nr:biopolymer transporter ExbD [Tepidisphaeraceae bacterium]
MKKVHIPETHVAHPNVTPLIDIVMCLIIFYMLVAKIGVTTGAEKMDIPESIVGTDIKDMGNTLTLNVRPGAIEEPLVTALVKLPGSAISRQSELKLRDPASGQNQLLNTLKMYRQQNDQFKVIIRGEADMPYRFLEPVLVACADANVRNVNFNTKKVSEKTGG